MTPPYKFKVLDYVSTLTFDSHYATGSEESIDFGDAGSASGVSLYATSNGEGLRLDAFDKRCLLLDENQKVLALRDLRESQFTFDDGSRMLFANRANSYAEELTGTEHDDLLIDTHTAVGRRDGHFILASGTASGKFANGSSGTSSLSASGRWLVFASEADNLSSQDSNAGSSDIFLRDVESGTTTLLSRTPGSAPWGGPSQAPWISADGSKVAYMGRATDLQGGDDFVAIIVQELGEGGTTTIVNTGAHGEAADLQSFRPALSGDGRYVAFSSDANNLVSGDHNDVDIFVRDLLTGGIELASVSSGGTQANDGCGRPTISGDGRYVAFNSDANNLVAGDNNNLADVFVRDLVNNETFLVTSYLRNGVEVKAALNSYNATISADGKHVAFQSYDDFGQSNDHRLDIWIKDISDGPNGGQVTCVSSDSAGNRMGSEFDNGSFAGSTEGPRLAVSGNGRYVVFISKNIHLVHDDVNALQELFVKDTTTGEIVRIRENPDYVAEDGIYSTPSISEDGSVIGFARLKGDVGGAVWQTYVVDNPLLNEVLTGGAGNDTYQVARSADSIVEAAGPSGGIDTVRSSVRYRLGANLENLELAPGTSSINGTGNKLNNVLMGNAGTNTLDGRGGTDTVSYVHAVDAVTVSLAKAGTAQGTGAAGVDTLYNIENIVGSPYNDTLTGSKTANVLDGGAGADTLKGGSGNDTYVVNDTRDKVVERFNCGDDTVRSSVSWALSDNVEHLVLLGRARLDGTGNELANSIVGNSAANLIDGGAGADRLTGKGGKDTFILSSVLGSDTVTDFVTGADRVLVRDARLVIGDHDGRLDGAVAVSAGDGFDAASELVLFEDSLSGRITASKVASLADHAETAYGKGDRALFVVNNGEDTQVYLFKSSGADADVSASELKLLATLDGVVTSIDDYFFGA